MLKLNIPNLEAIRNWCNEKFQPKGNYITKSEISNEVNETEITLSDLSETVPEAISAMSEEKKLKNLLSHIKAFMTGSKALIDLCVTTGMITQQNINDENKVPSAALLYSLNDALNGQVAQINSNLSSKASKTDLYFSNLYDFNNMKWCGNANTAQRGWSYNTNANGCTGFPSDIFGCYLLTIYDPNGQWGAQLLLTRDNNNRLYVRNKNNNSWNSWSQK